MSAQVQTRMYLADALDLSPEEHKLRAYLNEWLPEKIFDCHTHANCQDAVLTLSPKALRWVYSTFPDFSIEDSKVVQRVFYQEKQINVLMFANPYKGIDHRKANRYLVENSRPPDKVALCGIPDDISYTIQEIQSKRYAAIKSYPNYFEPPAKTILEFFPLEILEIAQDTDIPIILHLPQTLAQCLGEVLEIIDKFPKLQIILAHLGRHHTATSISGDAFRALSQFGQVVVDTSMVTSVDLLGQALDILGQERVLYGSDEPMNLLRYIEYEHPTLGRRLMSTYPYHWLDREQQKQYGYLAKDAVHLHWQVLMAIREALFQVFPHDWKRAQSLLFLENSQKVFKL